MSKFLSLIIILVSLVSVKAQFRLLTFESTTNMAAVNPNSINYNCLVNLGNGYGRFYKYDATDSTLTNGTTIVAPTTGVGRWTEIGMIVPISLVSNVFNIITNSGMFTFIEDLGSTTVPSINFTNGFLTKNWTLSANSFATNLIGVTTSSTNEQTIQLNIIQPGAFTVEWPVYVNLDQCSACLVPPVGTNVVLVQWNGLALSAYSKGGIIGPLTPNFIPLATTATTLGNSLLYQPDVYGVQLLAQTSDNLGSYYELEKRGTTGNTNAAVVTNAIIGELRWRGWNGSNYSSTATAISSRAAEDFTTSANGAKLVFETTPIGGIVRQTVIELTSDQKVKVPALTANRYLATDGSSQIVTTNAPALAGNPTASVGTSAINGTATTFLRSDGAPQINQSMNPTWLGLHTYLRNSPSSAAPVILENLDTTAGTGQSIGLVMTMAQNSGSTLGALSITTSRTTDWTSGAASYAETAFDVGTGGFLRRHLTLNRTNVIIGTAITNVAAATDGFLYAPSITGIPTGVPTTYTGKIPMEFDSLNNKLYFYSNGAWHGVNEVPGSGTNVIVDQIGPGTPNYIPKWIGTNTIGDSIAAQLSTTNITIAGTLGVGATTNLFRANGAEMVYTNSATDGSSKFSVSDGIGNTISLGAHNLTTETGDGVTIFAGNLIPKASVTMDLGSTGISSKWRDLTLSRDAYIAGNITQNGTTNSIGIFHGSGSPEGVLSKSPGSIYSDWANGLVYIKNTGTGNTGWLAVGTSSPNVRTITSADSPYTVVSTDYTILCNAVSGNITVNLPAAATSSRELTIKKIDASGNSVTIDGNASETIDGSTTKATTTQYFAWEIQSDLSNWYIK